MEGSSTRSGWRSWRPAGHRREGNAHGNDADVWQHEANTLGGLVARRRLRRDRGCPLRPAAGHPDPDPGHQGRQPSAGLRLGQLLRLRLRAHRRLLHRHRRQRHRRPDLRLGRADVVELEPGQRLRRPHRRSGPALPGPADERHLGPEGPRRRHRRRGGHDRRLHLHLDRHGPGRLRLQHGADHGVPPGHHHATSSRRPSWCPSWSSSGSPSRSAWAARAARIGRARGEP